MLHKIRVGRKVSSFVRKNARLLSLTGTLIVFVTFVVRDAIRDQARGTVEAYHAADALFQMRSDTEATRSLVFQTYDRLDEMRAQLPDAGHRPRTRVEVYLADAREQDDEMRATMETERNLVAMLAKRDALRDDFAVLDARFKQLMSEERLAIKAARRVDRPYGDAFSEVFNLGIDSDRLSSDAIQFSSRLQAHFKERQEAAEWRLTVVTWSSWFLYTLGWAIAFVGRYYQIGAGGLEE